ncbi:MAG TPA: hypothetical protein VKZ42_06170 [Flavobacteriaceae bacterium]|nr:hypothetical protein [Flavobacteriaceae bacterium]
MSDWDGRSKGSVLGYKIFVFCIKNIGIKSSYFILFFVALYYFLFQFKSNKYITYFYRKRLEYPYFKAKKALFGNYYVFGKTLIDRVAIGSGMRHKFTYEFDGVNILQRFLSEKKGGILISAHIGNFELAEYFFQDIDFEGQINLVTTDSEHRAIKNYLESVALKSSIKFILIQEDLSHIFQINQALAKNELICFTGDRYLQGTKSLTTNFLGKEAHFPAGPFLLASRLQVPVAYVYVMKETNTFYHLYTREATVKHRDAQALLENYVESVTGMIYKYPLQWFNYFDFWSVFKK